MKHKNNEFDMTTLFLLRKMESIEENIKTLKKKNSKKEDELEMDKSFRGIFLEDFPNHFKLVFL